MKNKNIIFSIASFLFLVSGSVLAYLRLIPKEIKAIPHYDSILHFLIFGIVAYFAHLAFTRKNIKIAGVFLPIGITLIVAFACIDESLQILSSARTFDLGDLAFSVGGAFAAYAVDTIFYKKKF